METFTLIAWIMVGQRVEEVQLPLLYAVQCTVFRDEMLPESRYGCSPAWSASLASNQFC